MIQKALQTSAEGASAVCWTSRCLDGQTHASADRSETTSPPPGADVRPRKIPPSVSGDKYHISRACAQLVYGGEGLRARCDGRGESVLSSVRSASQRELGAGSLSSIHRV